jgi:uncharacterized protein (TIGR02391 family)
MFLPKQRKFLPTTAASLNVSLKLFDFTDADKEIRATHKQSGFYFRVVELDMKIVRMRGYALYVYYTPTNHGVAVDPLKETGYSPETWEGVEKAFTNWLNWIKEEFDEEIEQGKFKFQEDSEVFAHWDELTTAPSLAHLHPTIQQAAGSRFASAHYSDAVEKACIALEKAVRDKASLPSDLGGSDLMNRVFSQANPMITLSPERGEREGYMFLFRGMWQALRNHHAHNDTATDPARALEWLGFISALFYKLDDAQPTAPTP